MIIFRLIIALLLLFIGFGILAVIGTFFFVLILAFPAAFIVSLF